MTATITNNGPDLPNKESPLSIATFPRLSRGEFRLLKASANDVVEVAAINQKLMLKGQQDSTRGFLIFGYTPEELTRFISTGEVFIWRDSKQVVGYAVIFDIESEDPSIKDLHSRMNFIEWEKSDIRKLSSLFYVSQVAIDPSYLPLGSRTVAAQFIDEQFTNKNLFCAVVEKPFPDQASLNYIRKLGFKRVGTRKVAEFKGLKDFQSGWYLRTPTQL